MRIWLLTSLLLVGCATPDPITVRVPVRVPCIEQVPERPALLSDAELAAIESDYELIIHIARDRRLRQGYQAQLEAAIEGCR